MRNGRPVQPERDEIYKDGNSGMEQDVHEMEAPGCETEDIIAQHVTDVHEWPVIVGANFLKCPDIGGKYLRDEPHLPDPGILHHLGNIVIDKSITKGVARDRAGHQDEYTDQENVEFLERKRLQLPPWLRCTHRFYGPNHVCRPCRPGTVRHAELDVIFARMT